MQLLLHVLRLSLRLVLEQDRILQAVLLFVSNRPKIPENQKTDDFLEMGLML